jgi:nickel-dependent lactate racemase
MTRKFKLPYGKVEREVALPERGYVGTFLPSKTVGAGTEGELILSALENPIGTPRLGELVQKDQRIVIITSDMTRPCPNHKLLPPVLKELEEAGVNLKQVTVVIALGLHRPMSEEELRQSVGAEVYETVRVINHDVEDVVHVGTTARGTRVDVFREVVEADFRLCMANVEFHYFAGYSGGAKSMVPGTASVRTVTDNHSHMVEDAAVAALLEGNPVREDLEEAANMVGIDFILNVIVDEHQRIVDAAAGHVVKAHRVLCQRLAEEGLVELPAKVDLAVVSAWGDPKDINLYQAQKALDNCAGVVRPGGVIILLAECGEGYGSKIFQEWMTADKAPEDLLEDLRRQFVLGGHKAAAISKVSTGAEIILVTSDVLANEKMVGVTVTASLDYALERAQEILGREFTYAVFPLGASTLPKVVN